MYTMKNNLEKIRDYFKREYLRLNDYFGFEQHPEKIEAVKLIIELIEKEMPKKPLADGLADRRCPACRAWLPFDVLNVPLESAPKRCAECGQVLNWKGD